MERCPALFLRLLNGPFHVFLDLRIVQIAKAIQGSGEISNNEVFGLSFVFEVLDDLGCVVGIHNISKNRDSELKGHSFFLVSRSFIDLIHIDEFHHFLLC
jgi:hypothetical protein